LRILSNEDIKIKRRKLSEYRQDPANANKGSERGAQMIEDSLESVGVGSSLVSDGNDYLVSGNKRRDAAERLGITEVIEIETDGKALIVHKRRDWDLLSAENKQARLAAYLENFTAIRSISFDAQQIAADAMAGFDFSMMLDPGELAFMIGNEPVYGVGEAAPETAPKETPPDLGAILQEKWQTAVGQLWAIPSQHKGMPEHRVICGDCRDAEAVRRLFDGKKAQIAFTSPPYAMQRANIDANSYGGIPEDEYVAWWEMVQANTHDVLVDGGNFFVNIKPHSSEGERSLYVMDLVLAMKRQWGWLFVDEHIWQRHSVPGAFKYRLKNGFEPIYEFAKAGEGRVFEPKRMGTKSDAVMVAGNPAEMMLTTGDYFNVSHETKEGIALPENIFHAFGIRKGVAHSAQYPVDVPHRFMMIYSNPKQIIYDPFLGSGTNIHAAEKARRVSYGIELLPQHLAVLCEEWSLLGHEPRLIG
jgi:site-specific DNA-methyltransferase (adenine-specific)